MKIGKFHLYVRPMFEFDYFVSGSARQIKAGCFLIQWFA